MKVILCAILVFVCIVSGGGTILAHFGLFAALLKCSSVIVDAFPEYLRVIPYELACVGMPATSKTVLAAISLVAAIGVIFTYEHKTRKNEVTIQN